MKSDSACDQTVLDFPCNRLRGAKIVLRDGVYQLELFGPFGLRAPDGTRIEMPSRKGRALIALLALSRNGTRSRSWLQAMLWGSRDPVQAQASLRRELSTLRKLAPPHGAALLRTDHDRVKFAVECVTVDVLSRDHGTDRGTAGEFLEGLDIAGEEAFEDWLRETRAQFARPNVAADGGEAGRGQADRMPRGAFPALPSKPSIAVLPFANLHAQDDRDHIADGMVEEISVALSRYSSLFVIASGSTVGFREAATDLTMIARELGVRYLLDGSVRIADGIVRVLVKLTDGIESKQVWADRFEDRIERVFELQDRVSAEVAMRIDSSIEKEEMRRAIIRPVDSPDAYHLYWRANALFRSWDQPSMTEAIELAEKVIELEPSNAWAPALAGFCQGAALVSGWAADPVATRARAFEHYVRAMRLGGDDPQVLGFAAGTLTIIGGDIEQASRHIERALAIHPGSASLLFWAGWVDMAMGRAASGIENFEAALRLNPRSAVRPFTTTGIGIGLLMLRRYAEAAAVLRDAVLELPFYPATLAALCASLAYLGKLDEARTHLMKLKTLGGGEGVMAILRDAEARRIVAEGLGLAASPAIAVQGC